MSLSHNELAYINIKNMLCLPPISYILFVEQFSAWNIHMYLWNKIYRGP